MRNRIDLRHLYVCSVDPPGCTDIDDALHCRELENGNLEVGVYLVQFFLNMANVHFLAVSVALILSVY